MTQAELSRHVRALVTSLQKSGLTVAGVKVTFVQGVPAIEVTTGPESPRPDADWRIHMNGPLSGQEYQRHGDDQWALVHRDDGFA